MSAAPRNTIDTQQASPTADSQKRAISPRAQKRRRESLQAILADLDDPIKSTPDALVIPETLSNSEAAYQELITSFSRNHTYSAVREDTNGQNDVNRRALYQAALESMLQDFYVSINLPEDPNLQKDWSQIDLSTLSDLSRRNHIRLSMPRGNLTHLLHAVEAIDITKKDLVSAFSSTKTALKSFFEKNKTWMQTKSDQELKTIKENLQNVLAVVDSLSTIVERSPLLYPNRDILNQENHVPAYATKEKPAKWPNKPKPKPLTSWKDVNNMFAPIEDSARPITAASTTVNEENRTDEIENWQLHTSLAIRDYGKLCQVLSIPQDTTIIQKLNNLDNDWIGKSEKIKELDEITDLLQQQVREAQATSSPNSDQLFEAKVAVRSIIEQFHSLKNLPIRELSGIKGLVAKARGWGASIYHAFQKWRKPKESTALDLKSTTVRQPKSKRSFWWALGFASIAGLFSGEPQQKATAQSDDNTITAVTNQPSAAPQVATSQVSTVVNNDITEARDSESTLRQASIQKRLQNTLKISEAGSIFRALYTHLPKDIGENQQTYLANTFAHILRPHLHGFHSNTDTAPLHITYLGSAPHHKHTFRVSSGGHSQEIRVHIPSWENIARGLNQADVPAPQTQQTPAPIYTGPSDMETEVASVVPPPPPGARSTSVHNAVEIDAALDALNQADQLPPTPVAPIPTTNTTTNRRPSRADIALEELAQSDRSKNRPA